jgi:hypothetical protein
MILTRVDLDAPTNWAYSQRMGARTAKSFLTWLRQALTSRPKKIDRGGPGGSEASPQYLKAMAESEAVRGFG